MACRGLLALRHVLAASEPRRVGGGAVERSGSAVLRLPVRALRIE